MPWAPDSERVLSATPPEQGDVGALWLGADMQQPVPNHEVVARRRQALAGELQGAHRRQTAGVSPALDGYLRIYAFLSQVAPFADGSLERLDADGRLLIRRIGPAKGPPWTSAQTLSSRTFASN